MKGLCCLFLYFIFTIMLQSLFGRYILLDIIPAAEEGVESRAGNIHINLKY